MQNRKGKYEKVLLTIAGLAALGVAGYLIWSSRTFNERLVLLPAATRNDPGKPPTAVVEAALKRLTEKITWVSPIINNKPVPLNKSIMLLRKTDGQLYDLLVPEPVLRSPMPNAYLVEHNLPHIVSPNVGDLDPDGDGFSTLEEFNKKTNPMDPASKPPVTDKLFLKQRIANDYIIKLNSSSPPYQVQRTKPEPKASKFVSPGDEFGFEKNVIRFKVVSFLEKKEPDPKLGEKDVSELTILDLSTNKPFVVKRNSPDTNLAEYQAEFEFLLGSPEDRTRTVKQGETFQIPGLGITYKVLEIEENKAVIAPVLADSKLGEPLTVPKR